MARMDRAAWQQRLSQVSLPGVAGDIRDHIAAELVADDGDDRQGKWWLGAYELSDGRFAMVEVTDVGNTLYTTTTRAKLRLIAADRGYASRLKGL